MAPAKQAKVIREFQKQSAQMDMTVRLSLDFVDYTIMGNKFLFTS